MDISDAFYLVIDYISQYASHGTKFIEVYMVPHIEAHHNLIAFAFLLILLWILFGFFVNKKIKAKEMQIPSLDILYRVSSKQPYFRKRDKIRYFVHRYSRKFQQITEKIGKIKSKDEKQRLMSAFARKLLQMQDDEPGPIVSKLPEAFFEPDTDEEDSSELPDELKLCLSSVNVFGQLDRRHYLQFFKYIQCVALAPGELLFKPGDEDSNMYIVRSGKMKVYYVEDGMDHVLTEVGKGGNIHSLLSLLDVLTGHSQPFKTVYARAITHSEVLQLPSRAFLEIFDTSPHTLIRMMQIISVRLGRVTFLALNNYLGLNAELLNKNVEPFVDSEVVKLNQRIRPSISLQSISSSATSSTHPVNSSSSHHMKRLKNFTGSRSRAATAPITNKSAASIRNGAGGGRNNMSKAKADLTMKDDQESRFTQPTLHALPEESARQCHSDDARVPSPIPKSQMSSISSTHNGTDGQVAGIGLLQYRRYSLSMSEPSINGHYRYGRSKSIANVRSLNAGILEKLRRARSRSPSGLLSRQLVQGDPYADDSAEETIGQEIKGKLSENDATINSDGRVINEADLELGSSVPYRRLFSTGFASPRQLSRSLDSHTKLLLEPLAKENPQEAPPLSSDQISPNQGSSTKRKFTYFEHRLSRKDSLHPNEILQQAKVLLGLSERDMELLWEASVKDLTKLTGLKDSTLLENHMTLTVVPGNTTLVKEGEEEGGMFFVVVGEIHCLQHKIGGEPSKCTNLFTAKPGEIVGTLSTVSREPSLFTHRTFQPAVIVAIMPPLFHQMVRVQANVALSVANLFVRRMSPFLRQIDFALEWTSIKAGRSLYNQGDMAHSVYILLNGRLRQVYETPTGTKELVEEVGRGELVGLLEALSSQPRVTTMLAIRDSEVARIPIELLDTIKRKAPQVVGRLIQLLSDRLLGNITGTMHRANPLMGGALNPRVSSGISMMHHMSHNHGGGAVPCISTSPLNSTLSRGRVHGALANLRTVAVLPASANVPLESFVLELQHSMKSICESLRLTSSIILRRLGQNALDNANEYKLRSWLCKQEDQYRMLFYVCDTHPTTVWTRRCIRQADCVLVVALAKSEPSVITPIEAAVTKDSVKVSRMLVLLYTDDVEYPPVGRTAEWLRPRPWIQQHFHIRCPQRMFASSKISHERLMRLYKRVYETETPSAHADMSRLARYLTGTSIGVALGGGGARGIAHIGVIRGLQEVGIPIDVIAGTSIGSFMGALWAEETRLVPFRQRAREFSRNMASMWNKLLDLTYPTVSFFSGNGFNKAIEAIFQKRQIEDLWIPYFCITTNITNSNMRIHTQGSLWRYVRASMSLSGYLPPLCDPYDGSLLLDGGYVNNLPADIMHNMGVSTIFAVDVGMRDDTNHDNYGDHLSGWKLLYKRILRKPLRVPNMNEIQSRLAYVSCVRQLEMVKESGICEYIRPKIEPYHTLQFGSFEEICEVGYQCITEKIDEWRRKNILSFYQRLGHTEEPDTSPLHTRYFLMNTGSSVSSWGNKLRAGKTSRRGQVDNLILGGQNALEEHRQFIDLAELVARIDKPNEEFIATSSDEDVTYFSGDNVVEKETSGAYVNSKLPKKRVSLSSDVRHENLNGQIQKNIFPQSSWIDKSAPDSERLNNEESDNESFVDEDGGYKQEDESEEDLSRVKRKCKGKGGLKKESLVFPDSESSEAKDLAFATDDVKISRSERKSEGPSRFKKHNEKSKEKKSSNVFKLPGSKGIIIKNVQKYSDSTIRQDVEDGYDSDEENDPLGVTASDSELFEFTRSSLPHPSSLSKNNEMIEEPESPSKSSRSRNISLGPKTLKTLRLDVLDGALKRSNSDTHLGIRRMSSFSEGEKNS